MHDNGGYRVRKEQIICYVLNMPSFPKHSFNLSSSLSKPRVFLLPSCLESWYSYQELKPLFRGQPLLSSNFWNGSSGKDPRLLVWGIALTGGPHSVCTRLLSMESVLGDGRSVSRAETCTPRCPLGNKILRETHTYTLHTEE